VGVAWNNLADKKITCQPDDLEAGHARVEVKLIVIEAISSLGVAFAAKFPGRAPHGVALENATGGRRAGAAISKRRAAAVMPLEALA
jgi:hypothetical protein